MVGLITSGGWFGMFVLLVGSWVLFVSIGMVTGHLKQRGTIARLTHPRQWEVVAGSMHREPVYPGEDDPVHYEDADTVETPAT